MQMLQKRTFRRRRSCHAAQLPRFRRYQDRKNPLPDEANKSLQTGKDGSISKPSHTQQLLRDSKSGFLHFHLSFWLELSTGWLVSADFCWVRHRFVEPSAMRAISAPSRRTLGKARQGGLGRQFVITVTQDGDESAGGYSAVFRWHEDFRRGRPPSQRPASARSDRYLTRPAPSLGRSRLWIKSAAAGCGDRRSQKPLTFWVSPKRKKAMEGFFHGRLASRWSDMPTLHRLSGG
jgi:hypothetical protein